MEIVWSGRTNETVFMQVKQVSDFVEPGPS